MPNGLFGIQGNFLMMAERFAAKGQKVHNLPRDVGIELATRYVRLLHDPWPPGSPVDTGTMRRGFSVRPKNEGADVINPVEYWPYVNYGTYKMEARPFVELSLQRLKTEGHVNEIVKKRLLGVLRG